jgi:hypothetical protein
MTLITHPLVTHRHRQHPGGARIGAHAARRDKPRPGQAAAAR